MSRWYDANDAKIEELVGKILVSAESTGDELRLKTTDGKTYLFYHSQDCCESVTIDDICGDLDSLVGSPLLIAREDTNVPDKSKGALENESKGVTYDYRNGVGVYEDESCTWTFYQFATIKGYVTVKWYGSSNGYYSERVDLVVV